MDIDIDTNTLRALHLVPRKARDLTPRGHAILNAGVPQALALGLIDYCSRNGYRLSPAGKKAIAR